jgi:EmrB/QacA subfamily drug resistance transporter
MADPSSRTEHPAATEPDAEQAGRQRWALWLTCTATVMLVLDVTIVNVALPPIQRGLHTSLTDLEWVVDAYALTLAALLLISGSFADRLGRRRVFRAGMALFTVGSLLCSVAANAIFLIVARAVQGCGGAALFATALAILGQEFEGRQRTRALSIWGAAVGGGLAIGPLSGGLLTQYINWRAIFFVNVPIGLVVLVLSGRRLGESVDPDSGALDWLGAVLFGGTLSSLVFALLEGQRLGWSHPLIAGCLAAAVVMAVVFVRVERKDDALFDLTLFGRPMFDGATIAVIGQGFAIGPVLFYLIRYLQEVVGLSPLQAGLRVFPLTVAAFVAALVAGRLPTAIPHGLALAASLGLLGVGFCLLALVDARSGWSVMLPGILVAGLGWGAVNPLAADCALSAVPQRRSGMASGINNTARQVGIAVGLASLGSLWQHEVARAVRQQAPVAHFPASLSSVAAKGGLSQALTVAPPSARSSLAAAVAKGSTSGFHAVTVVAGAGALAVGALVAWLSSLNRP